MSSPREITILYDGDCPMCARYAQWRRLHERFHTVTLLNARENADLVARYRAQDWDINQGLIVTVNNAEYFGQDAWAVLHRLAAPNTANRLMVWALTRPRLGPFMYRCAVRARNLMLWQRGRPPIS